VRGLAWVGVNVFSLPLWFAPLMQKSCNIKIISKPQNTIVEIAFVKSPCSFTLHLA
jgi:hypothetical protein